MNMNDSNKNNRKNKIINYRKLLSYKTYMKKKIFIEKNEYIFFFGDLIFKTKNNSIKIFNNLNSNPLMIIDNNEIGLIKKINKTSEILFLCLNNKFTLFFIEIHLNLNKYFIYLKLENCKNLFCSTLNESILIGNDNIIKLFSKYNNFFYIQTSFKDYFYYPISIKKGNENIIIDFFGSSINFYDIKTFELINTINLSFKITNIKKIWYLEKEKCLFIHLKSSYLIYFNLISYEIFQYLSLGNLKYVEIMENKTFLICKENSEIFQLIKIFSNNNYEEYAYVPFGRFYKNYYIEYKLKKYKDKFNVNEISDLFEIFDNNYTVLKI